jgi:hypothetical protein
MFLKGLDNMLQVRISLPFYSVLGVNKDVNFTISMSWFQGFQLLLRHRPRVKS